MILSLEKGHAVISLNILSAFMWTRIRLVGGVALRERKTQWLKDKEKYINNIRGKNTSKEE